MVWLAIVWRAGLLANLQCGCVAGWICVYLDKRLVIHKSSYGMSGYHVAGWPFGQIVVWLCYWLNLWLTDPVVARKCGRLVLWPICSVVE